jgi:hypothetical protein
VTATHVPARGRSELVRRLTGSVVTGRTLDQVAAGAPAGRVRFAHYRALARPLPRSVAVMKPTLITAVHRPGWIFETMGRLPQHRDDRRHA